MSLFGDVRTPIGSSVFRHNDFLQKAIAAETLAKILTGQCHGTLASAKQAGKPTQPPLETCTVCMLQLRALPQTGLHNQRQSHADIWHTTPASQKFSAGKQLQSDTAHAVII